MSHHQTPVVLAMLLLLFCCSVSFSEDIVRWRPSGQLIPRIEYVARDEGGKCTIVATEPSSGMILFSSELAKDESDDLKAATQSLLSCRDVDYKSIDGNILRIVAYSKDKKDPTTISYAVSELYNNPASTFIPHEDIDNIAVIMKWLSLIDRIFRKRGLERLW